MSVTKEAALAGWPAEHPQPHRCLAAKQTAQSIVVFSDPALCTAQSCICTQPSLYPTQTIPGVYPVPSIHLKVCSPKTKSGIREHTDFLLLPCKRGKVQHTSG